MAKRKRRKGNQSPFAQHIADLIPVTLLFLFLVFLAGVATVQKIATVQDTTAAVVTGAAVTDLAAGKFSVAAIVLLLFVVFIGGGILGIGSYFFVQINRNNHTEFMVKETIFDLGRALIPRRRRK